MVAISSSGSGEGPGRVTAPGYSTARTRFRLAEGTRVATGGSFGLDCRQPRSMDDLGPFGYGYGHGFRTERMENSISP